ncbi:hypothetical protein [Salinivibrio sharmensis]|uniref:Transmembrane protein n=1 Tax=Salinivibrio sharmensis TaxID=390883 RepID=A0ABX3KDH4_9GAMM|nr:hypothetical protein [Salinivibrio sharmensis]OOE87032.1 hypothetical protein BZG74_11775 [Salinivibrio sharmensis]
MYEYENLEDKEKRPTIAKLEAEIEHLEVSTLVEVARLILYGFCVGSASFAAYLLYFKGGTMCHKYFPYLAVFIGLALGALTSLLLYSLM